MTPGSPHFSPPPRAVGITLVAVAVGVVSIIIGWIFSPIAFYRAYLHSWLLWTDVSLGCMGFTMVIHLLGGAWGMAVRRLAEAGAMVLPIMAVLFVPIAIAAVSGSLYPWADASTWHADPALVHKRPYTNAEFFIIRAVIYGVIWIALAWMLWHGSRLQERGAAGDPAATDWLYPLSGVGMVVYVVSMGLFASTDWIMSLELDYKSTVFGMIIVAGQGVSALCVLIAALALLVTSDSPTRTGHLLPRHLDSDEWQDLGSVLLTASMFLAYLVVCQFVVNWMGNDQPQVPWYYHRMNLGWYKLDWIMVALLLVMPLVLLLFREIKRRPRAMLIIAVLLLATRGLNEFTMTNAAGSEAMPMLRDRFSWLDVVLPIGIGGIWVLAFLWWLASGPVMLERQPEPEGAPYAA
jgi:hypothetical protein